MNILGIDPGRQKTGLAVLDQKGQILWRAIVPTPELAAHLERLIHEWPLARVALGHSTGSEEAAAVLKRVLAGSQQPVEVEIVNERDSTLQARALYFEAHPPSGWQRFIPLSLQSPSEPIDDFAAAILARRALAGRN